MSPYGKLQIAKSNVSKLILDEKQIQFRFEAFNALNNVNLFLPNSDLSLASFGKSTQAHEARTMQGSLRFIF